MSVCPECKSSTHTQKSTAILATQQSYSESNSSSETKYNAYVPVNRGSYRREETARTSKSSSSSESTPLVDRIDAFSWRQLKEFDEKNPLLKMFDESPPASPRILTQKELRDEHLSDTAGYLGCLTLVLPFIVCLIYALGTIITRNTESFLGFDWVFIPVGSFCLVWSIPTYYIIKRRKQKAWDESDQQKLVQNQIEHDDYLVQYRAYMSQKNEYDNNVIIINNSIRTQREKLEQRIKNTWYCNKCDTLFWPGRESGGWEIVPE